jgi:hypothetical protein
MPGMKHRAARALALSVLLAAPAALPCATFAQEFPSPEARETAPVEATVAEELPADNPARNPDAARSVHLWWEAPPAASFVNEVTIDESVPGSYFMACGFSGGYFGLQELADKKKIALFSVWDEEASGGNAPSRVEVLSTGDGVTASRFGGEGTGAKTTWPFAWKTGRTYKMLVRARPDGENVIYSAYIAGPDIKGWKQMASLRVRSTRHYLQGLYSFAEDFRRDGKSLLQQRRARFGSGWVSTPDSEWIAVTRARFGADGNTHRNIDGGVQTLGERRYFFLATGGLIRQQTPLGTQLEIAPLVMPN